MTRIVSPLLFIWSGLLFGVSFVATPAKFLAHQHVERPAADIERLRKL